MVRRGMGKEVFVITAIKQDDEKSPFRYESTDDGNTSFFSELEIIAYLEENGSWKNV
jgi:hypothetical protein